MVSLLSGARSSLEMDDRVESCDSGATEDGTIFGCPPYALRPARSKHYCRRNRADGCDRKLRFIAVVSGVCTESAVVPCVHYGLMVRSTGTVRFREKKKRKGELQRTV